MRRCIELAKKGLGTTYPNPLVGCVITRGEKIIGEGWHRRAGEAHAEVNAIQSVEDKSLLAGSALYVNLEPCNHHGRTPPCTDRIISSKIKNVIIGSVDPNPKVSGKGIAKLQAAGCAVNHGILQKESVDLNKRFFSFHKQKRPYIILKWAQTSDGFIAPAKETRTERSPVWITGEASRKFVHKMRSQEQAILVGTNTAIQDNPSLTNRLWNGRSPVRMLIDRELSVPSKSNIFDGSQPTIVITEQQKTSTNRVTYELVDFTADLTQQICDIIYRYNYQSVIIEGGAKTLNSFIEANRWDEAFVFTGSVEFGKGIAAPNCEGQLTDERRIGNDILKVYKNAEL